MDISQLTIALKAAIEADTDFAGAVVERDEFVNDDPDRAQRLWVGIYRVGVSYNPMTLAAGYAGRYHLDPIQLMVIFQVMDAVAAKCADRLEAHIKNFIDLLLGNDSISGTIDHIKKFDIKYGYEPRSKKGRLYMQSAFITLELEVANS